MIKLIQIRSVVADAIKLGQPIRVTGVGPRLVFVRVAGRDRDEQLTWDDLRDAAEQESHTELRSLYAWLLEEAETLALDRSPIVVGYGRDRGGVWWTASVATEYGDVPLGRTWRGVTIVEKDEGGTHAQAWLARDEARRIAERIRRIGPYREVKVEP